MRVEREPYVWEPTLGPIPMTDILRYCGYRNSSLERTRQIRQRVIRILSEVRGALAPAAVIRRVANPFSSQIFPDCEEIVCGVVTVGPAIDSRTEAFVARERLVDAMVSHSIGSVAVEGLARQVNAAVNADLAARGLTGGRRRSPGYGKWPIEAQAELFAMLPVARIGVSLTKRLMMVPEKTISFAIPVRPVRHPADSGPDGCPGCEWTGCVFRDDEGETK